MNRQLEKARTGFGAGCLWLLLLGLIGMSIGTAHAKSLYLIANINTAANPVHTYDIQPAPSYLVFQASQNVSTNNGVGLAIDTDNKKLFITTEGSAVIRLLDANNFATLGSTTAPGASNLAGIVIDQGKRKLYTVDRDTNNLYVYSWDSATNTLTLDGGAAIVLGGFGGAHGLALDESRALLYVGDRNSTTVRYYSTAGFGLAGSFTLTTTQTVMGIAVDSRRNLVYLGNAYGPYGSLGQLVKYDLNTSTETVYTLPGAATGDNIIGVAVDEDTGNVYVTTGSQGSGGTDTLIAFDQNLNVLKNDFGDIGDPTGIAIPRADISFNPLNFSKTAQSPTVNSGANLAYRLCYDNLANTSTGVSSVTITDTIPTGTTFTSATGPFTTAGNTVTWNIGNVAAGAAVACHDFVVNVAVAAGGQVFNSSTIVGTIGASTIPTSQTVTTDVLGTAVALAVPGKGAGGGGSFGLAEVVLGALAAAALALRRRRIMRRAVAGAVLVGAAMGVQAAPPGLYIGGGVGKIRVDSSAGQLERDLAGLGQTVQSTMDNTDTGWKLFGGYQITPNFAVEAAYVDLGKVTSVTRSNTGNAAQLVTDVARVHPFSVTGLSLVGVASMPVGNFSLFAKAGVVRWKAHAEAYLDPTGSPYVRIKDSGTRPVFGLGADYRIPNSNWAVRGEWERYKNSRNDVDFVSVSVIYRF